MASEYFQPKREIHRSCKLPRDLGVSVWRYMDWWKFESLLTNKCLYLCRADLLEDKFEGTYSRQQLLEMEAWLTEIEHPQVADSERRHRREDRQRSYISSWCVGETDFDLMWKAYIQTPPGVAIRSTVERLKRICDDAIQYWPLDISLVEYFDHAAGQHINYSGTPAIFFNKDLHFCLDKELRIVHRLNMTGATREQIWLPVSLDKLISSVVLSPRTPESSVGKARKMLNAAGLNAIPVEYSRDDRDCDD